MHLVLKECASILNLCPFIKGHSSAAMSKHNLSSKLVVQNVSEVPVKPPVTGEEEHIPSWGLERGGREEDRARCHHRADKLRRCGFWRRTTHS